MSFVPPPSRGQAGSSIEKEIERVKEEYDELKGEIRRKEEALERKEAALERETDADLKRSKQDGITEMQKTITEMARNLGRMLDRVAAMEARRDKLEEDLRRLEGGQRPGPSRGLGDPDPLWVVEGTLFEASLTVGLRRSVFALAQKHLGFYAEGMGDKVTIAYEEQPSGDASSPSRSSATTEDASRGVNLHIKVLFDVRENAHRFFSDLDDLVRSKIKNIKKPRLFPQHPGEQAPDELDYVRTSHYKATDAEFSATRDVDAASIASSARQSSSSNLSEGARAELVKLKRQVITHQAVDRPPAGIIPQKAHIVPRAKCSEADNKNPNNYLGMSPTLHVYFDAQSGTSEVGIPHFILSYGGRGEGSKNDGEFGILFEAIAVFTCCNADHARQVSDAVAWCDNTIRFSFNNLPAWKVPIFVGSPDGFKKFVERRHKMTVATWKGFDPNLVVGTSIAPAVFEN